jgi:hypothetical protein
MTRYGIRDNGTIFGQVCRQFETSVVMITKGSFSYGLTIMYRANFFISCTNQYKTIMPTFKAAVLQNKSCRYQGKCVCEVVIWKILHPVPQYIAYYQTNFKTTQTISET